MKFTLDSNIAINDYEENTPSRLLYGDFNVINILYDQGLSLPSNVKIYPDSTGMFLALRYIYKKQLKKIVSTDYQDSLLVSAIKKQKKIYFFGGNYRTINILRLILRESYPGIIISGMHDGYDFISQSIIDDINKTNTDILFVGLGVGRQEKWISENSNLIKASLVISVGGWFRFLSGEKSRAPKCMRIVQLEWLYRLITEFPNIWKRYLIGFPKFIFRILTGKIELTII